MDSSETQILEQIEQGLLHDDAAFVKRMTERPHLSTWQKVRFAVLSYVGIMMVMMYSVNIGLAIAGYAVLITATLDLRRQRREIADSAPRPVRNHASSVLAPSLD